MSEIPFTKMHGWGNDFVVIKGPITLSKEQIQLICDRRLGVGADGVLVVSAGDIVKMEYWNADGTDAEMCGNGLRCVARFAVDQGMVDTDEFEVDTPVGVRRVVVSDEVIEVELGDPKSSGTAEIDGTSYELVDVGNPHALTQVDGLDTIDVKGIGARVESDSRFPDGTNVEFIRFVDNAVEMRVWERGVGETSACGTGMVAAALVGKASAGLASPVTVRVPGGEGQVAFRGDTAWLIGPATYSFEGVWTG